MEGRFSVQPVRTSITSGRDLLGRLLYFLNNTPIEFIQWDRLAVYCAELSKQFGNINDELQDAMQLKHFVLEPTSLDAGPERIPDLLRTKLLPEIEQRDQDLLREFSTEHVDKVVMRDAVEEHDRACHQARDSLTALFDDLKQTLDEPYQPPTAPSMNAALSRLLAPLQSGAALRESAAADFVAAEPLPPQAQPAPAPAPHALPTHPNPMSGLPAPAM